MSKVGESMHPIRLSTTFAPPRRGRRAGSVFLVLLAAACSPGPGSDPTNPPTPAILIGTDAQGAHNPPRDWPAAAGDWNGKGARYHPATQTLVYETYRDDIRGGSKVDLVNITAPSVHEYYVAGRKTGTSDESGTTVLYIANADGSAPVCLGCTDVVDGQNGVAIYKVAPSTSATPNALVRQTGAIVYANQNKDLATWYPDGRWIIAGVEMPRHALKHAYGNSEVGMFNDLWAISRDGRTWVQLTDFVPTWTYMDSVAVVPYGCGDTLAGHCPAQCQYGSVAPYEIYSCSASGQAPPASGTMRPTMSNGFSGGVSGSAKLAWAERIGLAMNYVWGGALQLALADVVMHDNVPALVNYQRNLTPTPSHPDGQGLWSNPGANTVIGAGYEPWSFSEDDTLLTLASDIFLSTSDPGVTRTVSAGSQAFTDAIVWRWGNTQSLSDITAYDQSIYPYADNGATGDLSKYGHWEEPVVAALGVNAPFFAFGSSANLTPPWNPTDGTTSRDTFALETWIVPTDRSSPAWKLTHFNEPMTAPRAWAYPTAFNPGTGALYLTVVPSKAGTNPPGAIYTVVIPPP